MTEEKKWRALLKYDPLGNIITKYKRWRTPLGDLIVFVILTVPSLFFYISYSGAKFQSVDYFSILFGFASLIFVFVQIQINTQLLEAEKNRSNRDFVLKYYSQLISEFNALDNIYDDLLNGIFEKDVSDRFPTLTRMNSSGILTTIKEVDNDLTSCFDLIIDDLIPSFTKIEKERFSAFQQFPEKLEIALQEIEEMSTFGPPDKSHLLGQCSHLKWPFWRKEMDNAKKLFKNQVVHYSADLNRSRQPISDYLSDKIYDKFVEVADKEYNPIRDKYVKKGEQLKTEVTNKIIPIMIKRMSSVIKGFSS